MSRKTAVGLAVTLALAGTVLAIRGPWRTEAAVAQVAEKAVLVEVASVIRKTLPTRLESLGTITPMAAVAIKARLETAVTKVHVVDGAEVNQGDLLFSLDSRQIEAEIKRVEAVVAGAQAQLQHAERDVSRHTELVGKGVTSPVTLNNGQTQVNVLRATLDSNNATLENLKIQLDYTKIRAPISGRMSVANATAGNFVRPSDTLALSTIVQLAPIYVAFTLPQSHLGDLQRALTAETTSLNVLASGQSKPIPGQVTVIDHTVDPATGMVTVRATLPNADRMLWPGALVTTQLTLRHDDSIIVPSLAVNAGQTGEFVFVIKDGRAEQRQVKVARTVDQDSVIAEALQEGEMVVTNGQLLLSNGSRVTIRDVNRGS